MGSWTRCSGVGAVYVRMYVAPPQVGLYRDRAEIDERCPRRCGTHSSIVPPRLSLRASTSRKASRDTLWAKGAHRSLGSFLHDAVIGP